MDLDAPDGPLGQPERLPKETPQLREYARSLLLEGEYSKAWRETNKFVSFYEDSEYRDDNQFLRGEIKVGQGKWLDGAKEFQNLISTYPDTDHYDEAIASSMKSAICFSSGAR